MAPPWTYASLIFPLLILLYGVIAQDPQSPTVQPVFVNDSNIITNGSSTAYTDTDPVIQTTAPDMTTMDIVSMISQRDKLRDDNEQLKVAVIILAVFFTLAVVAIVIGLVWFFIIRRKFQTFRNENRAQKTSQNVDISANKNAKEKTDKVVKQQEQELRNSNSIFASGTSGDYEDQGKPPDKAQPKKPPSVLQKVAYINTTVSESESSCGPDVDEREVYIELDKNNANSDNAEAGTTKTIGDDSSLTDEIYENYTKEAGGNYSALDSETQYDHHYD